MKADQQEVSQSKYKKILLAHIKPKYSYKINEKWRANSLKDEKLVPTFLNNLKSF